MIMGSAVVNSELTCIAFATFELKVIRGHPRPFFQSARDDLPAPEAKLDILKMNSLSTKKLLPRQQTSTAAGKQCGRGKAGNHQIQFFNYVFPSTEFSAGVNPN